jgi:hypothetical protein
MKKWIDHPGCSEPVPLRRWIAFQAGEWLYGVATRLKRTAERWSHWGVYGTRYDDDIPF